MGAYLSKIDQTIKIWRIQSNFLCKLQFWRIWSLSLFLGYYQKRILWTPCLYSVSVLNPCWQASGDMSTSTGDPIICSFVTPEVRRESDAGRVDTFWRWARRGTLLHFRTAFDETPFKHRDVRSIWTTKRFFIFLFCFLILILKTKSLPRSNDDSSTRLVTTHGANLRQRVDIINYFIIKRPLLQE